MSISLAHGYTLIVYQKDLLDAKTVQTIKDILDGVNIDFYQNQFKLCRHYQKFEKSGPTLEQIRDKACRIIDTGLYREVDIEEYTRGSCEKLRKVFLDGSMIKEKRYDDRDTSRYPSDET